MAGTGVAGVYVLGEADGSRPLADLYGPPLAQVPVGHDDVVALPYSSGTMGLCKGVMLTHRNLVRQHRPEPGSGADRSRREPGRGAAVLPHLRHAGADELRAAGRGDHRHAATFRP